MTLYTCTIQIRYKYYEVGRIRSYAQYECVRKRYKLSYFSVFSHFFPPYSLSLLQHPFVCTYIRKISIFFFSGFFFRTRSLFSRNVCVCLCFHIIFLSLFFEFAFLCTRYSWVTMTLYRGVYFRKVTRIMFLLCSNKYYVLPTTGA